MVSSSLLPARHLLPLLLAALFVGVLSCSLSSENLPVSTTYEDPADITREELDEWRSSFCDWHYHPDYVLPPDPNDGLGTSKTDCPRGRGIALLTSRPLD